MDVPYGVGLNPVPFIASAYLVGLVIILGYSSWLYRDRLRLRRMIAVAREDSTTGE